jgi:hypothetical protein
MQITEKEIAIVFSWETNDPLGVDFRNLVKSNHKNIQEQNIVIDLTAFKKRITPNHILEFSELGKSFVVASSTINIHELPNDISVAPTLKEALDLIEMEEIERDLGY